MMTSKNELQVNGGISLPAGMAGSVAYSPLNHMAVEGYAFYGPQHSKYSQFMAGYYWKNIQSMNFEVYAGVAGGKGTAMKAAGDISLEGDYKIYYTQFNLGQNKFGSRNIDYGLGIKVGITDMDITDNGYYENNSLDPVYYHSRYYLFEPMAFIRIGKNRLKTCFQVNATSLINSFSDQSQLPYHSMALGISLSYFPMIRR